MNLLPVILGESSMGWCPFIDWRDNALSGGIFMSLFCIAYVESDVLLLPKCNDYLGVVSVILNY